MKLASSLCGCVVPVLLLLQSATFVLAQETDATDLSRYEIFEDEDTTPDLSEIEALKMEYSELLTGAGCEAALPKMISFAKNANFAANIIKKGNEPYYDAGRDDQKSIASNRALLNELISAETRFNILIYQRNRAWVEEAKCLIELGDKDEGVIRLMRALDLISGTKEKALWEEARQLLWEQVGFAPK